MKIIKKPAARRPQPPPNARTDGTTPTAAKRPSKGVRLIGFGMTSDGVRFARVKFRDQGSAGAPVKAMIALTRVGPHSPDLDRLVNLGAALVSSEAKRDLIGTIQEALGKPHRLVTIATRTGWLPDAKVFVLPGMAIGAKKGAVLTHLDDGPRTERFDRFRCGGTLSGFRQTARLAVGNSRLQLLLCHALSGPIAALLGVEQVGLMLVGPPSSYKTTLLAAAASVWGCHTDENLAKKLGFCQAMSSTVNDLEDDALAVNHTYLPVDETRNAGDSLRERAQFIINLVMRLETGMEKGRKNSVARRRSTAVPFAFTSNESLGQLAAIAGMPVDDAHHGRLIGIPLPSSSETVFETLHGSADAAAFGKRLRKLRSANFGAASLRFLKRLARQRQADEECLLKHLHTWREFYLKHAAKLPAVDRQLDRVHQRMATLYATGRFLIRIKLVDWDWKLLRQALLDCTRDHVALVERDRADRKQLAPVAPPAGEGEMQLLRRYHAANLEHFVDLRKRPALRAAEHDHNACPGYVNIHPKRGLEYLLTEAKLVAIVGGAQRAAELKRHLAKRDLIEVHGSGAAARYSVKRRICKGGTAAQNRRQVVAIRAAAFA